jgi:SAM-dependent methyltransferase
MGTKTDIRRHYEEFGWQPAGEGSFHESRFVDGRAVMARYYEQSHARAGAVFRDGGRYFLDAGCGGHPMRDYGRAFRRHVCVDFSPRGLAGARGRLGGRGLYVVADVVHLPFKPSVFDGAVNAYNLFHVPREEQAGALAEMARVLAPGRPGVVLYGRATSWLAALRRPLGRRFPALRRWRQRLLGRTPAPAGVEELYYFAHPPRWFHRILGGLGVRHVDTRCLRLVDEQLTRRAVPDNRLGRALVGAIQALERRAPRRLAPLAAHCAVTFRK